MLHGLTQVLVLGMLAGGGEEPPAAWEVWWSRNRVLLLGAEEPARKGFREWEAGALLLRTRRPGLDGDRALLAFGRDGGWSAPLFLLEEVRHGGRRGQAAILALGLSTDPGAYGHLRSLLEDRVTGRALAGRIDRPVPPSLRAAAALALGVNGHPVGYNVLRFGLDQNRLPDGVREAALIGLSFSGAQCDAIRFVRSLVRRPSSPLLREAGAVAVGRHSIADSRTDALLIRALQTDPTGAGRGAAVAFWYAGCGPGQDVARALREAALSSPDRVTRSLAAVALAGRGDVRAEEVVESLLADPSAPRAFAVIALGLLGRARPDEMAARGARLSLLRGDLSGPAEAARHLLRRPRGPARPGRDRSAARIAGGNALFLGSDMLEGLMDLASALVR